MKFECKLAKYKSWTRQMKKNSEFKKFVFHAFKLNGGIYFHVDSGLNLERVERENAWKN
jgi:hypothetical protein